MIDVMLTTLISALALAAQSAPVPPQATQLPPPVPTVPAPVTPVVEADTRPYVALVTDLGTIIARVASIANATDDFTMAGVMIRDSLAANAAHATLLQHPCEFGLNGGSKFADFIEQERATVRLLEKTRAVRGGPGKCPTHVAEQFAFNERTRNGGAVDRDKPRLCTR